MYKLIIEEHLRQCFTGVFLDYQHLGIILYINLQ